MDVSEIQRKILASKEQTYNMKCNAVRRLKLPIISLALNVPGWPKTDDILRKFFFTVLAELKIYALANRILILNSSERIIENENGLVYIAAYTHPIDSQAAKALTEKFELNHQLGRFIDVDVCDKDENNVSSETEKRCFFCMKHSAIDCMRIARHSIKELRSFQHEKIVAYLLHKKRLTQVEIIAEITQYALLAEISLDPKPGLVTPTDTGSHTDMDYQTFLQSTTAITNIFTKLYRGILIEKQTYSFEALRILGIEAEMKMNAATGNINTHKGAIFLLLILGSAVAELIAYKQNLTDTNIKAKIMSFKETISNDPLLYIENTNGNNARKKIKRVNYGIRNEIVEGLPSLFNAGLTAFRVNHFSTKTNLKNKKNILIQSLLSIMSVLNDTNVIHRSNDEKLDFLKMKSKEALVAIMQNNWKTYYQLCKWTKKENISPGGSADILIGTIFTYLCQINPKLKTYEL